MSFKLPYVDQQPLLPGFVAFTIPAKFVSVLSTIEVETGSEVRDARIITSVDDVSEVEWNDFTNLPRVSDVESSFYELTESGSDDAQPTLPFGSDLVERFNGAPLQSLYRPTVKCETLASSLPDSVSS